MSSYEFIRCFRLNLFVSNVLVQIMQYKLKEDSGSKTVMNVSVVQAIERCFCDCLRDD